LVKIGFEISDLCFPFSFLSIHSTIMKGCVRKNDLAIKDATSSYWEEDRILEISLKKVDRKLASLGFFKQPLLQIAYFYFIFIFLVTKLRTLFAFAVSFSFFVKINLVSFSLEWLLYHAF